MHNHNYSTYISFWLYRKKPGSYLELGETKMVFLLLRRMSTRAGRPRYFLWVRLIGYRSNLRPVQQSRGVSPKTNKSLILFHQSKSLTALIDS
jgi:hypothetical protein